MRDLRTPLSVSIFDNGSKKDKKEKSVQKKQKQAFKKHVKMLNKYEKDFDKRLKKSSADEMSESTKYTDRYKSKK
jgi:hypothetical protein